MQSVNQAKQKRVIYLLDYDGCLENTFVIAALRENEAQYVGREQTINNYDAFFVEVLKCPNVALFNHITSIIPDPAITVLSSSKVPDYRDFYFAYSKIYLVYAQIQKIANQYPNDELIFKFYDDKCDILNKLHEHFSNNKMDIPNNASLHLVRYCVIKNDIYNSESSPEPQNENEKATHNKIKSPIEGNGVANPLYGDTNTFLVKQKIGNNEDFYKDYFKKMYFKNFTQAAFNLMQTEHAKLQAELDQSHDTIKKSEPKNKEFFLQNCDLQDELKELNQKNEKFIRENGNLKDKLGDKTLAAKKSLELAMYALLIVTAIMVAILTLALLNILSGGLALVCVAGGVAVSSVAGSGYCFYKKNQLETEESSIGLNERI